MVDERTGGEPSLSMSQQSGAYAGAPNPGAQRESAARNPSPSTHDPKNDREMHYTTANPTSGHSSGRSKHELRPGFALGETGDEPSGESSDSVRASSQSDQQNSSQNDQQAGSEGSAPEAGQQSGEPKRSGSLGSFVSEQASAGEQSAAEAQPASSSPPEQAGAEAGQSDEEVELDDDQPFEFDLQDDDEDAAPLESLIDDDAPISDAEMDWYILKVQVNRESSICDALKRRVKMAGLERYFADVLVPTEDVREYTKTGKQRVVKKKLYPGYIVVRMAITDETWFLVRETPGIGDFTGAIGKPAPLSTHEIEQILATSKPDESKTADDQVRTTIRFKVGDRVRVKEGNFQNYEGEVSNIDERNGRVTVMINIFGRPNPVVLNHWHVEQM